MKYFKLQEEAEKREMDFRRHVQTFLMEGSRHSKQPKNNDTSSSSANSSTANDDAEGELDRRLRAVTPGRSLLDGLKKPKRRSAVRPSTSFTSADTTASSSSNDADNNADFTKHFKVRGDLLKGHYNADRTTEEREKVNFKTLFPPVKLSQFGWFGSEKVFSLIQMPSEEPTNPSLAPTNKRVSSTFFSPFLSIRLSSPLTGFYGRELELGEEGEIVLATEGQVEGGGGGKRFIDQERGGRRGGRRRG